MNKFYASLKNIMALLASAIILVGCGSDDQSNVNNQNNANTPKRPPIDTRYLFAQTNDPRGNQVVSFSVDEEGAPTESRAFSTGSVGDADEGDFNSQSALRVYNNYLLVANPGDAENESGITDGNSAITVFRVLNNGYLSRIDQRSDIDGVQNIDSMGKRAVSIDWFETDNKIWVVVANQHSTRVCITPQPGGTLADCIDQYGQSLSDLTTSEEPAASLQLFSFSAGVLTYERELVSFPANIGGPSQVSISPDGTKIATALFGIPHLDFPSDARFQKPSRTYIWDFDSEKGSIKQPRYFEHPGIGGSIGFAWDPDSRYVYVSSATLDAGTLEANLVALDSEDIDAVFTSDGNSVWSGSGAVPSDVRPEACWVWINQAADRIYTVAFQTNTITTFTVDGADLAPRQTVSRMGVDVADAKDIVFSADGKFAYVLGAYQTYTLSTFDVAEDGSLMEQNTSPLLIQASRPNGEPLLPSTHAYQGLTAFPGDYLGY